MYEIHSPPTTFCLTNEFFHLPSIYNLLHVFKEVFKKALGMVGHMKEFMEFFFELGPHTNINKGSPHCI
jgi:hypothetical protein